MRQLSVCLFLLVTLCPAHAVESIVHKMELNRGLVIHVGPVDATVALSRATEALVHSVAKDPTEVSRSRKALQQFGLAGRVTVSAFDGRNLPFIDQVANLIIVNVSVL